MEIDPLTQLKARLKLLRRHLLEQKDLLFIQKEARQSLHGLAYQYPIGYTDQKVALIAQIIQQAEHLTLLSVKQADEQKRLRTRQQQEEIELERVLNYSSK